MARRPKQLTEKEVAKCSMDALARLCAFEGIEAATLSRAEMVLELQIKGVVHSWRKSGWV